MPWKITKLPVYPTKKTKKESAPKNKDAANRAAKAAKRKNASIAEEERWRRNLILRIKAMREQKFKWADIDEMMGRKRCNAFYYRNRHLCEPQDEEPLREFNCAQCGRRVKVISLMDRRKKFCSAVCEKRYWRHKKKAG